MTEQGRKGEENLRLTLQFQTLAQGRDGGTSQEVSRAEAGREATGMVRCPHGHWGSEVSLEGCE